MNRVKVYSSIAGAALIGLFSSCLGGEDKVQGNAFGIAETGTQAAVTFLNAGKIGNLYDPAIEQELIARDCYRFDFAIKPEEYAAIDTKAYLETTISNLIKLPKETVKETTEETQILPYEHVVAIQRVYPLPVINNILFLATQDSLKDWSVKYQMYYNIDSVATGTTGNVYNLYLLAENQNPTPNDLAYEETFSAHDLQPFYNEAVLKEKSDTTTEIRCKIHFINAIRDLEGTRSYSMSEASTQVILPIR